MILVGDSLGMTMQGYKDTLPVTVDEMIVYGRSVVRGCKETFVVVERTRKLARKKQKNPPRRTDLRLLYLLQHGLDGVADRFDAHEVHLPRKLLVDLLVGHDAVGRAAHAASD